MPYRRKPKRKGDADVYRAEAITDCRFNIERNRYEFLVKWEGYADSESTWEPEENIIDRTLLRNFRRTSRYKQIIKLEKEKAEIAEKEDAVVFADDLVPTRQSRYDLDDDYVPDVEKQSRKKKKQPESDKQFNNFYLTQEKLDASKPQSSSTTSNSSHTRPHATFKPAKPSQAFVIDFAIDVGVKSQIKRWKNEGLKPVSIVSQRDDCVLVKFSNDEQLLLSKPLLAREFPAEYEDLIGKFAMLKKFSMSMSDAASTSTSSGASSSSVSELRFTGGTSAEPRIDFTSSELDNIPEENLLVDDEESRGSLESFMTDDNDGQESANLMPLVW